MKKATINVIEVMETIDDAIAELKEGIPEAKLSKKARKEIRDDLGEVIALAEQLKNKKV